MEHGGKNGFSITGSMLMIAGPIFTFKNLRKNINIPEIVPC
jgi:hypothetical protein